MIAATRTRLLQLRGRARTVASCRDILQGRRQALIREFLSLTRPFLSSREQIRAGYARALAELQRSRIIHGQGQIASLATAEDRQLGVLIRERNLLGLHYLDIEAPESAVRGLAERGYDYQATTGHLEETCAAFEELVDALFELARYEGKFRRLALELMLLGRRIRVLENRVLPGLQAEVKSILQTLGERDREDYYRLKRFKERRLGGPPGPDQATSGDG